MRYILLLQSLLVAIFIAHLVEADDSGGSELRTRDHALRKHHKRGYQIGMLCGKKNSCPPDSMLTYYRCCRYESDQCCWYIRIWVIVVFGALLLKAFLACFVSFFRCVCC